MRTLFSGLTKRQNTSVSHGSLEEAATVTCAVTVFGSIKMCYALDKSLCQATTTKITLDKHAVVQYGLPHLQDEMFTSSAHILHIITLFHLNGRLKKQNTLTMN